MSGTKTEIGAKEGKGAFLLVDSALLPVERVSCHTHARKLLGVVILIRAVTDRLGERNTISIIYNGERRQALNHYGR